MRNEESNTLSATEAVSRIRAGKLSARELLEACLIQIERREPALNAWAYLAPDQARETANGIDETIRLGYDPGSLAGVPVGIKDIFNTYDMPTAMGSSIWSGFTPGNDARLVSQLRLAGSVVLGKTITAEFAVHAPGPTVNPHNPEHTPGTSSSGAAAAVAACMVPLALGSQTAGSTIRPASYCGIYGFKPSFGLLPRTGSLKTVDTLDTAGLFSRTVEDLALMFNAMRVRGPNYPISHALMHEPIGHESANRPWRVGFVRGPTWQDAEPYVQEALTQYASALTQQREIVLEEVELPKGFEEACEVHETIYCKALSYYFKGESQQSALISPVFQVMMARGQQISLAQYRSALERQAELAALLDAWFERGIDVLVTLSSGGEAPKGLETPDRRDNCPIWTLCGVPAMNIPVFVGPLSLPFGVQMVARRYRDLELLRFCRMLHCQGLAPDVVPAGLSSTIQAEMNLR